MKYIRTKDGIENGKWKKYLKVNHFEIVKQADTIEELCDEFVYVYKNMTPFVSMASFSIKGKKLYEYEKDQFLYATKECKKDLTIYGAIWTDKGLIYVAKMNDKGELDLL